MKHLFQFRILVTLILFLGIINAISAVTICPELSIEGDDKVCSSTFATSIGNVSFKPGKIYNYDVNYNKYHIIRWEVKNGDIVLVDGNDTTSFLKKALAKSPYAAFYNGNPNYNNPYGYIPPYTIYLTWVWGGEYSVGVDFLNGPSITSILGNVAFGVVKDILSKREAQQISIMWDGFQRDHSVTVHVAEAGVTGICGSKVVTKNIISESKPYITANINGSSDLSCNQGSQISGNISGTSIYWSTVGAVVSNNWGTGITIDHFNQVGQVPISVAAITSCGSIIKTFTFNVTQPDFGHVQQNGVNVDEPGALVSLDCQGNFNLEMPKWVSGNAIYTWELPGNQYNIQTNTYTKTIVSGADKRYIQGKLPTGGLCW